MDIFLPILVIFFAVFTQSLTGFGVALVAMSLLPEMIGIQTATPLVALVAMTLESFLLLRYRTALNLKAILPLMAASAVGIPIGLIAFKYVDEEVFLTLLGVVLAGYGLYGLFKFRLPELHSRLWAYGAGFLAGVLSGAYNTGGPPVVVYADCKRWSPSVFKSNLQGLFLFNDVFVITGHALSQNFTPLVWKTYLWALPAIALGILAGTSLDRYLNPESFRKVVLVLLVVMGIRLIL
jgi:hypothetical protein